MWFVGSLVRGEDGATVATTTKKKSARSSRSRSKGSRGRGASLGARVVAAFREHVGDRRSDAWGLLLILIAVIAALGTWADAGGPVGAFLDALFHSLVGEFAMFVPVALGALGIAIVFDKEAGELGRIGVGSTLVGVSVIAGWHLLRGAPHVSDGIVTLHHAGGLLGFLVSRPLVVGLSIAGAWAVLLFLLALGTLVLTRTSLQTTGSRPGRWVGPRRSPTTSPRSAGVRRRRPTTTSRPSPTRPPSCPPRDARPWPQRASSRSCPAPRATA